MKDEEGRVEMALFYSTYGEKQSPFPGRGRMPGKDAGRERVRLRTPTSVEGEAEVTDRRVPWLEHLTFAIDTPTRESQSTLAGFFSF